MIEAWLYDRKSDPGESDEKVTMRRSGLGRTLALVRAGQGAYADKGTCITYVGALEYDMSMICLAPSLKSTLIHIPRLALGAAWISLSICFLLLP